MDVMAHATWQAHSVMGLKAACLTRRELQVLILIALGKTSKEIAFELEIAFETVTCHRARILSKLCARNSADVARYAIRHGLIRP
jgi:DNA-binding NarL/FixJ family response regulator